MKKVLLLAALMLAAMQGWTQSVFIGDLYYNLNNSTMTAEVGSNPNYTGDLVIPSSVTYNGGTYTVTAIGEVAFIDCSNMTSVTIPNSVTSIGRGAFGGCRGLTSVTIPGSVTLINEETFLDCSGLTSVTIGNGVTTIGNNAFNRCYNLTSVTIGSGVTTIGQQAFSECSIGSVTIPNSVTSIGQNAFCNTRHIVYNGTATGAPWGAVSMNGFVDGGYVYSNSTRQYLCAYIGSADSITIPSTVNTIGNRAFIYCRSLRYITIPNGITSIGDSTFFCCDSLIHVTIPNSVTTIGNYSFYRCFRTSPFDMGFSSWCYNIVIPDSVTTIGSFAFYGCGYSVHPLSGDSWDYNIGNLYCYPTLTITIGRGVTSIGSYAFCCGIRYLYLLPANPPAIGICPFWNSFQEDYLNQVRVIFLNGGCDAYNNYYTTNPNNRWYQYCSRFTTTPRYNFELTLLPNVATFGTAATIPWPGLITFDETCAYRPVDIRCDSAVVISATANPGYHFDHWSTGSTANPDTIILAGDSTVTAYFIPDQCSLTMSTNDPTMGTFTDRSGIYTFGDTVIVSATCNVEHHHVWWSEEYPGGSGGSSDNPHTITILGEMFVTANFVIDSNWVWADNNNDDWGWVNGVGYYPYGSTATLEAIPYEGHLFLEWSDGNTDNPRSFTMTEDYYLEAIFSDSFAPSICMVSVQNNHNLVIWDDDGMPFDHNIYREGVVAGDYELVATIPYDQGTQWLDVTSHPINRSYRYTIASVDHGGYESYGTDIHKTMHLTISKGVGNSWNLVWTPYEGADYSSYQIYRGSNPYDLELIDQFAADGNVTYADYDVDLDTVYYQVAIVKDEPCNTAKSINIIRSNIQTNGTMPIGIEDVDASRIKVYAIDGRIVVEGATDEVLVYDITGRHIATATVAAGKAACVPVPETGVYIVKVGNLPAKKVVVIR